jgi:hypothetical protein
VQVLALAWPELLLKINAIEVFPDAIKSSTRLTLTLKSNFAVL